MKQVNEMMVPRRSQKVEDAARRELPHREHEAHHRQGQRRKGVVVARLDKEDGKESRGAHADGAHERHAKDEDRVLALCQLVTGGCRRWRGAFGCRGGLGAFVRGRGGIGGCRVFVSRVFARSNFARRITLRIGLEPHLGRLVAQQHKGENANDQRDYRLAPERHGKRQIANHPLGAYGNHDACDTGANRGDSHRRSHFRAEPAIDDQRRAHHATETIRGTTHGSRHAKRGKRARKSKEQHAHRRAQAGDKRADAAIEQLVIAHHREHAQQRNEGAHANDDRARRVANAWQRDDIGLVDAERGAGQANIAEHQKEAAEGDDPMVVCRQLGRYAHASRGHRQSPPSSD